jgi:hypothetical protein
VNYGEIRVQTLTITTKVTISSTKNP